MSLEIELPDDPLDPSSVELPEEDIDLGRGIKKYVQVTVDAWFKTPARIFSTVCLVFACIALISWNLSRLAILDELIALESTEFELDVQLSNLELELASIDVEGVNHAIERESEKVFQGFPELAAWTQTISEIAAAKHILFSYKANTPHISPVPEVLEVPLILEFKASPESADNLFEESMELVGRILRDQWHLDVVATHARGDGERLLSINLQTQVWVKDRFGFVDVAQLGNVDMRERDAIGFE